MYSMFTGSNCLVSPFLSQCSLLHSHLNLFLAFICFLCCFSLMPILSSPPSFSWSQSHPSASSLHSPSCHPSSPNFLLSFPPIPLVCSALPSPHHCLALSTPFCGSHPASQTSCITSWLQRYLARQDMWKLHPAAGAHGIPVSCLQG